MVAKIAEEVTLRDLCKTACDRHTDIEAALKHVKRQLDHDPTMLDRLTPWMVDYAIRNMIHSVQSEVRAVVKQSACTRGIEVIAATANVAVKSFLRTFTINGRWLADITGKEVRDFAEKARDSANGWLQRAAFLEWIAPKVADDEIVGEKVDDAEAAKQWAKIAGGAQVSGQPTTDTQSRRAAPRNLVRVGHHTADTQGSHAGAHSNNGTANGHAASANQRRSAARRSTRRAATPRPVGV